jgi:PKD repeat protein
MSKGILMKQAAIRVFLGWVAFLAIASMTAVAPAQPARTVRIVCYNIQCDTPGIATPGIISPTCGLFMPFTGAGGTFNTNCTGSVTNGGVLEGIGEEIINGDPAQPIDVLALEETTSNSITVQPIVNALNAFYSYYGNAAGYAMSPYQATQEGGSMNVTNGNGPNAMVYNTNTLQLIASVGVGTPTGGVPSGNGVYRQPVRYEFALAGVTPGTNDEFYVYVSHYKASSGSTDDADRLGEATIIRNDEASNLPANARVLYVGDYNPDDNSGEPGYQTICSNSAPNGVKQGQGVDPLNILWGPYTDAATTINWSVSTTNTNILFMMSEESYEVRYRDDLQVMTSNVYYDVTGGLQYIHGSYHSFGNNGSFTWATSVNTTSNTALNDLDPALTNLYKLSAAVLLEDLTGASDHLPIVADYLMPIPATILPPSASFTAIPTSGAASLTVNFTDQSSGSITGWAWAFGDGNTSTSQNPSDIYVNPGAYTVREIVFGPGGAGTDTVVNLVNVYDPFAWWQLNYFGSTNNNPKTAPGGDYTGTGMSNTNKFLAGFNPTNAAAYLHIIGIVEHSVAGNTNVAVTYLGPDGDNTYTPGIASRTNVLDYITGDASGNYTNGGWQDTGQTNILSGGNGSGVVTNMTDVAIPSASTNRYYRVRVVLP